MVSPMTDITWHGVPATLTASDSPMLPWVVTLPEGCPDLGYAPGSQFLTDAHGLSEAR